MKFSIGFFILVAVEVHAGGPLCVPDSTTAFLDFENQAFSVSYDVSGNPQLYRQCTDMSNQQFVNSLNTCSVLTNPIDGLGISPVDNFLYGLMPTDDLGIGSHLELTFPSLTWQTR